MVELVRVIGAALILLAAIVATLLRRAPLWLPVAYLMLGLVSFGVYGFDKRAARRGDWRVTEASLHGIDLIGGIAGGLLGQAMFRHKTRKFDFAGATGAIALAHLTALSALLFGFVEIPAALF
jgi:uncharacterized membrane protein YsdA (DUF1294 family)